MRLKREQAADEFTSKMVRAIVNGMSPPDEKWSKFFLEDGVLCHHAKSVKNPKTQTVIPKSLRALVFELLHSKSCRTSRCSQNIGKGKGAFFSFQVMSRIFGKLLRSVRLASVAIHQYQYPKHH